jgi:hypothetical protein
MGKGHLHRDAGIIIGKLETLLNETPVTRPRDHHFKTERFKEGPPKGKVAIIIQGARNSNPKAHPFLFFSLRFWRRSTKALNRVSIIVSERFSLNEKVRIGILYSRLTLTRIFFATASSMHPNGRS